MTDHEMIGVGFGPANIALAIALQEMYPHLSYRFVERRAGPRWQSGQLLRGADIQHSPHRDFVTPRNPRSYYTFINYLHEHGRLLSHLAADFGFPLRREYAEYIEWASKALGDVCSYRTSVSEVRPSADGGRFEVVSEDGAVLSARCVVLGPGRSPHLPLDISDPTVAHRAFHAAHYLERVKNLERDRAHVFLVAGGSQSAVEIVLDLLDRFPRATIVNATPGLGYALKDTSPFTEQAFLPMFTDYYYGLSTFARESVDRRLRRSNYGVADADVIYQLVHRMYEDTLLGQERVQLHPFTRVASLEGCDGRLDARLRDDNTGAETLREIDACIFATGYMDVGPGPNDERAPPLVEPLTKSLEFGRGTHVQVNRDYSVLTRTDDPLPGPLFLNGLCENTHGLGDSGSFSLLSLRAETIANSVATAVGTTPARATTRG